MIKMIGKPVSNDAVKAKIISAMINYDDLDYRIDDVLTDWKWCERTSMLYHSEWRKARSAFYHNTFIEKDGILGNVHEEMKNMSDKYGRYSMTFNTLMRMVSIVKLDNATIKAVISNETSDPPAFDHSLRASENIRRLEMRKDIVKVMKSRECKEIEKILETGRSYFRKLCEKDHHNRIGEVTLLSNGTTTGLEADGFNLSDIMGNIYAPADNRMDEFVGIAEYFGCMSDYSEMSDFVWLETGDRIPRYTGGERICVPDKDGKIREVYRLYPWVQILSKSIHHHMDKIAKMLDGNYTYSHKKWITNLTERGWHKDKFILCTDMTKYSDTLDRSFILEILCEMGIPEEVLLQIDRLFSLDILDKVRGRTFTGTAATYQGQYADFPFITIVNLVIQSYIYYKSGRKCKVGYKAAVGDDTGMVFEEDFLDIIDLVEDAYASVGININKEKTTMLREGKGRIEFVKIEITKRGITPHMNPASFYKADTDQMVRDIFDNVSLTIQEKENFLIALFGKEPAKRLMELSRINGGIKDDPIEASDIIMMYNKQTQIRFLIGRDTNELISWLNVVEGRLKDIGYKISDTVLIGFMNKDILENKSMIELDIDEQIKLSMISVYKGSNIKAWNASIYRCLGKRPSELERNYDNYLKSCKYDKELVEVWEVIKHYSTAESDRRKKEMQESRRISVYEPIMLGLMDVVNTKNTFRFLYPEQFYDSVAEYRLRANDIQLERNYVIARETMIRDGVLKKSTNGIDNNYNISYQNRIGRLYESDRSRIPSGESILRDYVRDNRLNWDYLKTMRMFEIVAKGHLEISEVVELTEDLQDIGRDKIVMELVKDKFEGKTEEKGESEEDMRNRGEEHKTSNSAETWDFEKSNRF
jgi:hypothetical protein